MFIVIIVMMSKGAFACVFACKPCLFAKFQQGPQFAVLSAA